MIFIFLFSYIIYSLQVVFFYVRSGNLSLSVCCSSEQVDDLYDNMTGLPRQMLYRCLSICFSSIRPSVRLSIFNLYRQVSVVLQQLCAHVLRVHVLAAAVGVHDGHEYGGEHHHK